MNCVDNICSNYANVSFFRCMQTRPRARELEQDECYPYRGKYGRTGN